MTISLLIVVAGLVVGGLGWRWLDNRKDRALNAHAIDMQRLRQEREHAARELDLKERQIAIDERKAGPLKPPAVGEIPPDLIAFANNESESWAREDAMQLIDEAFTESNGNWDLARSYVAVRTMTQPPSRLPKDKLLS